MSIFNSLGSNYDFSSALQNLFTNNDSKLHSNLIKLLEEKYNGSAILVYKGREALRLALRIIGKQKDYTVGICGFTCFAVYDAAIREGYKVQYIDIEKDSLNFELKTLEDSYNKNPKIKILIIQNTLGFPSDIEKISEFCKEKNIILIEDLAHSIGTKYSELKSSGSLGDFVALSFSQDKMIDGVSGGALIVKSSKYKVKSLELSDVGLIQQKKDRFYPMFTFLIRKTYKLGIGKLLHLFLKKADLLSKPMDNADLDSLHALPNWYCKSIYLELVNLEKNLGHRKKIASIYANELSKKIIMSSIASYIDMSSNLRFPVFIANRDSLIAYLKKYNIFISDIWYDAPVAPKKYLQKTNYEKGECPNSEEISSKILNLPTHKNISELDARFIADKINLWLK